MAFERTVLMLDTRMSNSEGAERDKKCRGSRAGYGITDIARDLKPIHQPMAPIGRLCRVYHLAGTNVRSTSGGTLTD